MKTFAEIQKTTTDFDAAVAEYYKELHKKFPEISDEIWAEVIALANQMTPDSNYDYMMGFITDQIEAVANFTIKIHSM